MAKEKVFVFVMSGFVMGGGINFYVFSGADCHAATAKLSKKQANMFRKYGEFCVEVPTHADASRLSYRELLELYNRQITEESINE